MIDITDLMTGVFRMTPAGREQLVVSNAVVRLTVPSHANLVVFQVLAQPVRMVIFGGSDPAAATGWSLVAGTFVRMIDNETIRSVALIREGGVDATVVAEYFEIPGQ